MWIIWGAFGWEVRVNGKDWVGSVWTSRVNQNDVLFFVFFFLLTCITLAYTHALPRRQWESWQPLRLHFPESGASFKVPMRKDYHIELVQGCWGTRCKCMLAAELKGILNSAHPECYLNKGDCGQHHSSLSLASTMCISVVPHPTADLQTKRGLFLITLEAQYPGSGRRGPGWLLQGWNEMEGMCVTAICHTTGGWKER